MDRFAAEVVARHGVDHVDLVVNNAGIAGGGSFVEALTDEVARQSWDRTFDVCWGGVLNGTRTFLPMLIRSSRGHLVNISSINGVYASLGPGVAHTAYSAAKFAVRGFSEALIEDLRVNAPHVSVSVVMPGHIGTDIVTNSWQVHGEDLDRWRVGLAQRGIDAASMDDDEVRTTMAMVSDMFRDSAPLSAADAAGIILDAVRDGRWRVLVGADARQVDETVRADPEGVYAPGRALFQILAE
jgi:NAD(P)-dependent dehydrogenase (short-subunit alcohol dehydrogenase family)